MRQNTRRVDWRNACIQGYETGNFIRPTVLEDVSPENLIASTKVFDPVLGLLKANDLDDAVEVINRSLYDNIACILTSGGANARKFRHEVQAGNIGLNIGVATPMVFFPFSGWKDSFFGVQHGQSMDAVNFFT